MLLLVVALSSCGRGSRSAGAPIAAAALRGANVLLVTIDTLRADHVGAYGSALGATPTIDRLAREGLRFAAADGTAVAAHLLRHPAGDVRAVCVRPPSLSDVLERLKG